MGDITPIIILMMFFFLCLVCSGITWYKNWACRIDPILGKSCSRTSSSSVTSSTSLSRSSSSVTSSTSLSRSSGSVSTGVP